MPDANSPRSRADEILSLLSDPQRADVSVWRGELRALSILISDAIAEGDADALAVAAQGLHGLIRVDVQEHQSRADRLEQRGQLLAFLTLVQAAADRAIPRQDSAGIAPGGHAHRFLQAVSENPGMSGRELEAVLAVDDTQVSRTGRRLQDRGFARKLKVGRQVFWEATARGRSVVVRGDGGQVSSSDAIETSRFVDRSAGGIGSTAPRDRVLGERLLRGRFDPPVNVISRVLRPAAQRGQRSMPSHRWVSESGQVDVTLAETAEARLVATIAVSADESSDVVVAVSWSTEDSLGVSTNHLVTPVPAAGPDGRRAAAYDLGPADELRHFGLGPIGLVHVGALSPDMIDQALGHRPYGNAVRAWEELTARVGDPSLRSAFDEHVQ